MQSAGSQGGSRGWAWWSNFRHGRNSVRRRAIMVKMMVEEVVIQAVMVG